MESQLTHVALSSDGIHFNINSPNEVLGIFYFRVFQYNSWWYAIAKGGLLYRSQDGLSKFQKSHTVFPDDKNGESRYPFYNSPGPRHVALHLVNSYLWIHYSNIDDSPEAILRVYMNLESNWTKWKIFKSFPYQYPELILSPTTVWEGVHLPILPSKFGAAKGFEHALRDPAIFIDTTDNEENQVYLLYTVAGEAGIAIAEILKIPFLNSTTF